MSTTYVRGARREMPAVEGWYTILGGVKSALEATADGKSFRCRIAAKTKKGEIVSEYGVRFVLERGRLVRVELTKDLPAGEDHQAEVHTIDTTFGNELGHWVCSCNDFVYRGIHRQVPHCKHTRCAHKIATTIGAI